MKRARLAGLLLAILLAGLALGWWAGRHAGGPAGAVVAPPAPTLRADTAGAGPEAGGAGPAASLEFAAADLLRLEPGSIERGIPLTGTLRAREQTLVRAKLAGELVELTVREGTAVRAGQRIARIDPTDFEARVREREAQRRSAEAQLEQARRTFENNRQLLEKGFISQNAFDNAQSGLQVAVANRDAALAQLAQARKALADTVVTAPMDGIVAERFAQVGEKVSPDTRIVSIVDLSRMEIEAPVPASEIASVRLGQPVSLRVEGIDAVQTGEVVRIAPSTAAGTRSVPVYIGLDNRDPRIRAGLFAHGTLSVERRSGVLVVPAASVRDAAGRSFVYVVADGVLREQVVTLGLRDPAAPAANGSTGIAEVTGGLKPGDTIVGVNLGTLRAGSRVRIAAAQPAAANPGQATGADGTASAAGDTRR